MVEEGLLIGFQSIGVTKDWRHYTHFTPLPPTPGFQSIGVTKDWRPGYLLLPYHRGRCFQSIGVTKDWRPAGIAAAWGLVDRGVSNQ